MWDTFRISRAFRGDFINELEENFQIIVPFYNDGDNFKKFVNIVDDMEVGENTFIFLDNGSETNEIEEFSKKNERKVWKVVKSKENLGFGGGIKYAANFVEKDYVAWMPGNLKLNPKDVYEVINKQALVQKYLYIKCRRFGRPFIDSLKTMIFGIAVSLYFNKFIYDAGGTPNLIHKDFFSIPKKFPNDFSFDIFVYFYCLVNNFKILRPKIKYTTRLHGNSHWQNGLISEIKLTLDVFKYKKDWKEIANFKF